jgi:serpin B
MYRLSAGLVALLALSAAAAPADKRPPGIETPAVVKGNTQFALDLYGNLRRRKGNLFFSPFSISTALAMTSAGARGATLEQMAQVLHLPRGKGLHPTLGALLKQANAGGKKTYQLSTANALWGQKGHRFRTEFLRLVARDYGGGLREVNFAEPDAARRTINAWVEEQTRERIKDLIKPGMLNADTRLVLTNAIYFKGDWASQFKKDRTRPRPFHLAGGKTVPVPLMQQTASFGYLDGVTFQVLELPYAGRDLSMVVFLPRLAGALDDVERNLTPGMLGDYLKKLRKQKVEVYLPRFKLTEEYPLKTVLVGLGMSLPFVRGKADFSGLDGTRELFLSFVVHKAFVEVNETGTEAAAATGVGIAKSAAGPRPTTIPVFRADRPFVFLIRDKRSGSILFLGRLVNPK